MSWLNRLLGRPDPELELEPELEAPTLPEELVSKRTELYADLERAESAIQRAMAHADEIFDPVSVRSSGIERRRVRW